MLDPCDHGIVSALYTTDSIVCLAIHAVQANNHPDIEGFEHFRDPGRYQRAVCCYEDVKSFLFCVCDQFEEIFTEQRFATGEYKGANA